MSFTELETKRIEKETRTFVEKRRPPPHVRPQLDIASRITRQSILIFEIRPMWRDPAKKQEIEVAKATYVKSRDVWRVYWLRADLKWHPYDPLREVGSLKEFLNEVDEDPFCCFWG